MKALVIGDIVGKPGRHAVHEFVRDLRKRYSIDLVIAEINVAVDYGLLSLEEVVELVEGKPKSMELVLTGRYAHPEIVKMADVVSEMLEIAKTYEDLGITGKTYEGAAEFYRFVGGTPLAEEKEETMDRNRTLRQVIQILCDELD